MKRELITIFLAICLVFGLVQATPAVVIEPVVTLTVGGNTAEFPMQATDTGFILPPSILNITGVGWLSLQMTTDITATDPLITWGLSATNLGAAPLAFGFAVGIPVTIPIGRTLLGASVAGGLTDVNEDGVSITPTSLVSGLLQDNALTPPGFTWSVGAAATFPADNLVAPRSWAYGPSPILSIAGPVVAGGPAIFSDVVGFTISPFDVASLTGSCAIIGGAPIPGSVSLLGTGLLCLLGLGRRMKA